MKKLKTSQDNVLETKNKAGRLVEAFKMMKNVEAASKADDKVVDSKQWTVEMFSVLIHNHMKSGNIKQASLAIQVQIELNMLNNASVNNNKVANIVFSWLR